MRFIYSLLLILSAMTVWAAESQNTKEEKVFDAKGTIFYKSLDESKYGKRLESNFVKDSLPSCGLALRGKYLYSCGERHFTIYDISDPLKPVLTARINNLSNDCRQICVYKDLACITARTDGLYIFDIKNPSKPKLLSHYDTMELATGIACDHDIAYVCQRQYGTEFIDISNPSCPKHLGFVLSGEAQSVDTANGILYAGDWGTRKFSIFDVRNPKNPQFIGDASIDGLGDGVYVRDGIGYAGTGRVVAQKSKPLKNSHEGNGLDIFSLANLEKPKFLARVQMPVQAFPYYPDLWGVQVNKEKIAYVNNTYNGIFCLNVQDPSHPKFIAYSIPWNDKNKRPDFMASLAVADGVIFAAGYHKGLWIIPADGIAKKISDRTQMPVPKGPIAADLPSNEEKFKDFVIYKTEGQIGSVCKDSRGKGFWLAAGNDGIHQIEIQENKPVLLRKISASGIVYDVKSVGDLLYSAECDKGFAIYKNDKDGTVKELSRFAADNKSVRQTVVSEDGHWAIIKAGNCNLYFLDVSTPEKPRVVYRDSYPLGIMYGREIVSSITKEGIASALFWAYGFAWYDLSGDTPKKIGLKPGRSSFMFGGAFRDNKLYYAQNKGYYIIDLTDTKPLDKKTFNVVSGLDHGGKIFIDGNLACVTDRRNGFITKIDITNPNKAKAVKHWEVKGHPDLGIFWNDRLIVPCGYAGLFIEK